MTATDYKKELPGGFVLEKYLCQGWVVYSRLAMKYLTHEGKWMLYEGSATDARFSTCEEAELALAKAQLMENH